MVMCDHFPLRMGRNVHPNLEIPLVAPTELGSDPHLTRRFSDRCGNVLPTTYIDCLCGTIHYHNISDNQNKHYIVDSVAGVNQCTTCLSFSRSWACWRSVIHCIVCQSSSGNLSQ